jgi:hypothetical protein
MALIQHTSEMNLLAFSSSDLPQKESSFLELIPGKQPPHPHESEETKDRWARNHFQISHGGKAKSTWLFLPGHCHVVPFSFLSQPKTSKP